MVTRKDIDKNRLDIIHLINFDKELELFCARFSVNSRDFEKYEDP